MNKEELEWLLEISTPTGLSYSGDRTITINFAKKVINYIEAYENMRKEAIEYIDNHKEQLHHSFDEPDWNYLLSCNPDDLLDILNKVGGDNE